MKSTIIALLATTLLLYFVLKSYDEPLPPSIGRRFERWRDGERDLTSSSEEVEARLFGGAA